MIFDGVGSPGGDAVSQRSPHVAANGMGVGFISGRMTPAASKGKVRVGRVNGKGMLGIDGGGGIPTHFSVFGRNG